MGNNTQEKKGTSFISSALIGAIAGGMEAFIINPLIPIRARLQTKVPIPWNWILEKKKWQFIKFLYTGAVTHVVGMSGIMSIRLAANHLILRHGFKTKAPSIQEAAIASFAGGVISSPPTTFMELGTTLKQTNLDNQKNIFDTYAEIIKKCGVGKSLTGVTCVAGRIGVITAGILTFTPHFKQHLIKKHNIKDGAAATLAGATVGATCSVSTHFFDTIKANQHKNLRDIPDPKASTISYVVRDILTKDGLAGFNRGLYWRTARVAPHIAIVSFLTEKLTAVVNRYETKL